MESIKKGLDRTLYWITVVLFALLVLIVVWQVFSRQVLSSPATWTDEGARQTFVWLGLFASAFLFGERGHIAVEVIVRRFPPRTEQIIAIVVQLIVLAFALIVLVWGGWRASQNAWTQELSALPFTFGQMYLALPVSGLLMAFYSIFYLRGLVRGDVSPYPDVESEDDPEVQLSKYSASSELLPESTQSPEAIDQTREG
ncbi:TRAP transporter small permease [Pseudactinotalea sp. HY158]|uniref:TRAP transporter small permease n=1 Tax=Pseudactinotalea sp. HY158 TaxID=2654547 RepID=UPI00129D129C|nr:TRAP transporter small permease [Pseudactinotalea sp. HY158]QGH69501.1 TRAP transporter small permease subunit [Pseudactinotalea sp. HY158]